jgi:hypothetical protein
MFRAITILSGLLLVVAGCGRTPATPEISTTPTPTPTTQPIELVEYSRQGRLVGLDDHLVVDDGGAASHAVRLKQLPPSG